MKTTPDPEWIEGQLRHAFPMKVALQLASERSDRLHKAIMAAIMHLELGDTHRVREILNAGTQ